MKTLLIVSRHPSRLFLEQAKALRGHFRVVVALSAPEMELYDGVEGIEVVEWGALGKSMLDAEARSRAELVAEAEQATGVSMYRATSNYLLYFRLISNFRDSEVSRYWESEPQIVDLYLTGWLAFNRIFDQYRPDLVFIQTPDHVYALLVQILAYQRGVFSLSPYFGPMFGECHVFLYTGVIATNFMMDHLMAHPEKIPAEAWERGLAALETMLSDGPRLPAYLSDLRARSQGRWAPLLRRAGKVLANPAELTKHSFSDVRNAVRYYRNQHWLSQHAGMAAPPGKYILFLLSHQPEASTTMQAPRWIDQERVIEQIAINAPLGTTVVVKEHPRSFGHRGKRYFSELTTLPNVRIAHPAASNRDLLAGASVVFTLTGSNGFEAWLAGKKVATLGRPYYCRLPGVRRLDHPADFWQHALDPDWSVDGLDDVRKRAAAAYAASVYGLGRASSDGVWPIPEDGGPRLAEATKAYFAFIEQNDLRPSDVPIGIEIASVPVESGHLAVST